MPSQKPVPAVKRVLIVDDEAQSRRLIGRAFKKFWPEVEVSQAADGFQAIRVAEEFLPDLVLLDLMLPGQDGFAVLDAMNKNDKLRSALVLGITAYNSPENIKSLMKKGAETVLCKPFAPADLKRILSPYLDGGKNQDDGSCQFLSGPSKRKKSNHPLLNAAAFLGLMFSGFQAGASAQSSSSLTKTARIEEPYQKNNLPFKRIAVLPFESWNEYLSGNTLSDYFVHNLVQNFSGLVVVERKDLQKILKEQFFSQTGAVSPETVASIGKLLGVDAVLIGKVTALDTIIGNKGSINILCRIVAVDTGQVLWSAKQGAKMKPKLIQFESGYKSPMEVADDLLSQAAQKSVEKLRDYYSQTAKATALSGNLQ